VPNTVTDAPPSPRARGLRFRRRAIDLVAEHDVREDRSRLELEFATTSASVSTCVPIMSTASGRA